MKCGWSPYLMHSKLGCSALVLILSFLCDVNLVVDMLIFNVTSGHVMLVTCLFINVEVQMHTCCMSLPVWIYHYWFTQCWLTLSNCLIMLRRFLAMVTTSDSGNRVNLVAIHLQKPVLGDGQSVSPGTITVAVSCTWFQKYVVMYSGLPGMAKNAQLLAKSCIW